MKSRIPLATQIVLGGLIAIALIDVGILIDYSIDKAEADNRHRYVEIMFGLILLPVLLTVLGMLMISYSNLTRAVVLIEATLSGMFTVAYLSSHGPEGGLLFLAKFAIYWCGAVLAIFSGMISYAIRIRIRPKGSGS